MNHLVLNILLFNNIFKNLFFRTLSINNDIKVKTVSVDKFQFMDSLNFLGSNLGLWPGLGLFQIIEGFLIVFFAHNWKDIKNKYWIHLFIKNAVFLYCSTLLLLSNESKTSQKFNTVSLINILTFIRICLSVLGWMPKKKPARYSRQWQCL